MSYTFKSQEKIKESYETFRIERIGRILKLTLSRPDELNSTNLNYYDDFVHFFSAVNHEDDVRCIVLLADGKHFCVGLDRNRFDNPS